MKKIFVLVFILAALPALAQKSSSFYGDEDSYPSMKKTSTDTAYRTSAAQPSRVQPKTQTAYQSQDKKTSIEIDYLYQTADFYWKSDADSRLTWKDVNMAGVELKLRTQTDYGEMIFGGSYVTSNSGYSMDDDLDNDFWTVSWGEAKANELSLFAFFPVTEGEAGKVFWGLRLKKGEYKMRHPYSIGWGWTQVSPGNWQLVWDGWIDPDTGDTQKYTFYTLGPSIGGELNLFKSKYFKGSLFSDLGLQLYYAKADWPYRADMDHPNSFEDLGAVINLQTKFDLEFMFSESVSLTGSLGVDFFRNPFKVAREVHKVDYYDPVFGFEPGGDYRESVKQISYTNFKAALGLKISF